MVLSVIQSFFLSTLEILLCLHAVIQHVFTKSRRLNYVLQYKVTAVILTATCALLSILSIFVLLLFLLPLAAYRKFVDIFLQYKYKDDYGGLFEGIDAMWALETTESRHIINCLLFINFTIPEYEIMRLVKEVYSQKIVYQFTSVRKRFLGYSYRLKNQVGVNDLIKEITLTKEVRTNKQHFERALAKLCNTQMPKNDIASFELMVCTKPIQFSEISPKKLYPLLIRIHHTVGDGVALLNFLLKNLADEQISVESEIIKRVIATKKIVDDDKKQADFKILQRIVDNLQKYGSRIYSKLKQIANVNIYHFAPTSHPDCNILHGPKLNGEKVLSYYIEGRSGYITKIKSIKNRIPGTTFTDILMTAVSASFWEYYKENSDDIPEQMHVSFVIRPMEKNLEYSVSEKTGQKEIKLGNKFSLGVLGLPIKLVTSDSPTALRERLNRVKKESEKLKNSVDILVYYWQLRFLTNLLPSPILNLLIDFNQASTIVMSNLPGIQAVHIQSHKLHDIIFWLPNIRSLGVGLSILTYDGRFQLGLVADKVLIPSNHKAAKILENIIKYIDLLDYELSNSV